MVNKLEPAERGSDWFAADSLDLRGKTRLAAGITPEYQYRSFVVYDKNDGHVFRSIVRNPMTVHAGASVILFERLRAGLDLPILGVFDKEDACPDVAGVKTTDPKTNGCPDRDRDKDKIPNDVDACPDSPGEPNADPKKNGCPKAEIKDKQIVILDQVRFKTNSADILGKDSEEILQAVMKLLVEHPEIAKLRVEGHTDNVGAAAANKTLSAARAASVVKWLVDHKVDKARMTSAGFGPDKPIGPNATADGRTVNRRVEFHIANEPAKDPGAVTPPPPPREQPKPKKP